MNGYIYDCANMSDEEMDAPMGMEWLMILALVVMGIFIAVRGTWYWGLLVIAVAGLMFWSACRRQERLKKYYLTRKMEKKGTHNGRSHDL